MSKKGGKSTPSKGEKGDKTRTTPTNELVPGILDNEEHFSKYRGVLIRIVNRPVVVAVFVANH